MYVLYLFIEFQSLLVVSSLFSLKSLSGDLLGTHMTTKDSSQHIKLSLGLVQPKEVQLVPSIKLCFEKHMRVQ